MVKLYTVYIYGSFIKEEEELRKEKEEDLLGCEHRCSSLAGNIGTKHP